MTDTEREERIAEVQKSVNVSRQDAMGALALLGWMVAPAVDHLRDKLLIKTFRTPTGTATKASTKAASCIGRPTVPTRPTVGLWLRTRGDQTKWERREGRRVIVTCDGDEDNSHWRCEDGVTGDTGKCGADLHLFGKGFDFFEGGMGHAGHRRRVVPPVVPEGDEGLQPTLSAYRGAVAKERTVRVGGTTWSYRGDGPLVNDHNREWATISVCEPATGSTIRRDIDRNDKRWETLDAAAFVAEIRAILTIMAQGVLGC